MQNYSLEWLATLCGVLLKKEKTGRPGRGWNKIVELLKSAGTQDTKLKTGTVNRNIWSPECLYMLEIWVMLAQPEINIFALMGGNWFEHFSGNICKHSEVPDIMSLMCDVNCLVVMTTGSEV